MNPKERAGEKDGTPARAGLRRRGQHDLDQAITALIEGGLVDTRAIAGQLGISPQSVRRHRRRLGLANAPPAARLTPGPHKGNLNLAAAIREMLQEGLSKREAARQLGVSEKTVYLHLKANRARPVSERPALDGDDGYPEALLRQVPRDLTLILPPSHLGALLRAAARCDTPAARESLRQALLLHDF